MVKSPKKMAGVLVAAGLLIGVAGIAYVGIKMVGADTVLPGFATAHLHLEVTVCEKSSIPVRAQFTPQTGKRFYFKERTFEVQSGLNTIEWYIRKIPGNTYDAEISSTTNLFETGQARVALTNDKVGDVGSYALVICDPSKNATATPNSDEPGATTSTAPASSATPTTAASAAASEAVPPPVPIPEVPTGTVTNGDDLELPV